MHFFEATSNTKVNIGLSLKAWYQFINMTINEALKKQRILCFSLVKGKFSAWISEGKIDALYGTNVI